MEAVDAGEGGETETAGATPPNRREFEKRFALQRPLYESLLGELEQRVRAAIEGAGIHPVMKSRVKSFESAFSKRLRLLEAGASPGSRAARINDIIGIRVICPFMEDVKNVEAVLSSEFGIDEIERKGSEHSFKEFGYESLHVLIVLPEDMKARHQGIDAGICEVQVRTILQESWAEVEHELVYKARFDPKDDPMRRKLAAVNAILALSDLLFQDIREYQRSFMDEISLRRGSFYGKVGKAIDAELFGEDADLSPPSSYAAVRGAADEGDSAGGSIDDLLLKGLKAHNKDDFSLAAKFYSDILERSPDAAVRSLVHKHRGMAYFAQSLYDAASEDFSAAMALEPGCYKARYYRGVVRCVQQRYGEAVADFDDSLAIHPYNFFCLFRRAEAYYHLGDYPKALADCEGALALEPDDSNANRLKGMVMQKLRM
jgi:putative GTP pyrophosphokinase